MFSIQPIVDSSFIYIYDAQMVIIFLSFALESIIVQQVTRINLKEQGKEEDVIGRSFCLLKENFPYGGYRSEDYVKKRQLLPHFEAFLTHFDDCLARKSDVQEIEAHYLADSLFMMSNGYSDLGNPKRQKELLERAISICEKYNHPIVSRLKCKLEKLTT